MDISKEQQGSSDKVIAQLNEADSSKRLEAIDVCAKRRDPVMVTPLGGTLGDENADVRKAATWALIKIGTEEAADVLVTALQNKDPMIRWIAVWGLGEIGTAKALMPLRQLQSDRTVLMPLARRILHRCTRGVGRTVKDDIPDFLNLPWIQHMHKSTGKMAKLAIEKIERRLE